MTLTPIEMVAKMVEGKRVYSTPEGKFYPSITTVISNNAKKQAGLATVSYTHLTLPTIYSV